MTSVDEESDEPPKPWRIPPWRPVLCAVGARSGAFAPDSAGWSSARNPYSDSSRRTESFERDGNPCRESAGLVGGRQAQYAAPKGNFDLRGRAWPLRYGSFMTSS